MRVGEMSDAKAGGEQIGPGYDPDRPRDRMPSLGEIFLHWYDAKFAEVKAVEKIRDIAEPWCFRCGWVAPSTFNPERLQEKYPDLSDDRMLGPIWDHAHGWLERCHLWDHVEGGPESVDNLVPMCVACHRHQPICETREAGLLYVNEDVRVPDDLQRWTDVYMGQPMRYLRRDMAFYIAVARMYEARWRIMAETVRLGKKPGLRAVEIIQMPNSDDPSIFWPRTRDEEKALRDRVDAERREQEAAWQKAREGHNG